jgi:hypothetical protein
MKNESKMTECSRYYKMDHADTIISQLIMTICNYSYCSKRVQYDKFQEEKHAIFTELQDAYTKNEIAYIEERIRQYNFPSFIYGIEEYINDIEID